MVVVGNTINGFCLGIDERDKRMCGHLDSYVDCYCLGMDKKNKRKCRHLDSDVDCY